MLTAKQRETYEFVRECMASFGRAPTYRQIAAATGNSPGGAYASVNIICERGWLARQGRRIVLKRDLPAPATVAAFDYCSVDYESMTDTGWPRLVDLGLA